MGTVGLVLADVRQRWRGLLAWSHASQIEVIPQGTGRNGYYANVIAAWPGAAAARVRPAVALRAE